MENKRDRTPPLEPTSDNPSQNSRLHAATKIQSNVTPEEYPEEERQGLALSSEEPAEGAPDKDEG